MSATDILRVFDAQVDPWFFGLMAGSTLLCGQTGSVLIAPEDKEAFLDEPVERGAPCVREGLTLRPREES